MRPAACCFLDACCVLAFVVIGRSAHHHGDTVAGVAMTAWPFLAGLATGLLVTRAWRRPSAILPGGAGAWLGTVVIGMLLRAVSGQGNAFAFILVTLAFLGLFMLGWRAAARGFTAARARAAQSRLLGLGIPLHARRISDLQLPGQEVDDPGRHPLQRIRQEPADITHRAELAKGRPRG